MLAEQMEATPTKIWSSQATHLSDSNELDCRRKFRITRQYWPGLRTLSIVGQALESAKLNNFEYRGISRIQDDDGVILDFIKDDTYRAIEIFDDGEMILTVKHGTEPSQVKSINSVGDELFL